MKGHDRCFPLPQHSRWLRIFLLVLILSENIIWLWGISTLFPKSAVDFFQHYMLGIWVNQGGKVTDVLWPERVGFDWPSWAYGIIPFLPYQPLLLPWMRLLAWLPPIPALLVWQGGMILLWWWMARPAAHILKVSSQCIRLLLLLFPPFWASIYLGNIDGYLAALVTAALILRYNQKWVASGYLWGWVTAFKPFLFLGTLPLLRERLRTGLLGFLLGLGHAAIFAWLAVGSPGLRFFFQHVPLYLQRTTDRFLAFSGSLQSWFFAWIGPATPLTRPVLETSLPISTFAVITGLFLTGTTFWIWRPRSRDTREPKWAEGLWLSLAFLLGSLAWPQYRFYLFLPLVALSRYFAKRGGRLSLLWFLLLPLLVSFYIWIYILIYLAAPYRVMALSLGSIYLTFWLFFLWAIHEFNRQQEDQHNP